MSNTEVEPADRRWPMSSQRPAGVAPTARLQATLAVELNPTSTVEKIIVQELGRRAAQLQDFDEAIAALCQEGAGSFANLLSTGDGSGAASAVARAAVLSSDRAEVLLRQSLATARGFGRALQEFRSLRAVSLPVSEPALITPDARFLTEVACCAHLVRRFVQGVCCCRRCGAAGQGSFVASRLCWQCHQCETQTGVRWSTCMERSPLRLATWFHGIRAVLFAPEISADELAAILSIARRQTVRGMARRIRAAIASENPTARLAGLDQLYFA